MARSWAGDFDGNLYLAMRLVRGVTLKQLIVGGEIDPARALRLLTPVADALDAAHAMGLVHRDVKPQNILVDADDRPYLADFGLTRNAQDTALTGTGQFVGTIDYIAPEVLRGETAGGPADVYALAGVLHECLTGEVPFPRSSEAAVLFAHAADPPPAASHIRPDLPVAVDAVLRDGMAKDPGHRHGSAGGLLSCAATALATAPQASLARATVPSDPVARGLRPIVGETEAESLPAPESAPVTKPARRRRTGLAVACAGLFVAIAGVAYAAGHHGDLTAPAAPPAVTASSAALTLSAPARWTRLGTDASPAVPGLSLRDPVSLQSPDLPATGVLAGVGAGAGPTLLPAGLRRRITGGPPTAVAVHIGKAEALRYSPATCQTA